MYSNNRFALALFSLFLVGLVDADENLEANSTPNSVSRLELLDLNSQLHRLSEYRGKVVLVNFWTSWCTSCIREFPSLKRLNRAIDARRFALLAVNVREGKGIAERFRQLQDDGIVVLMDMDGKVATSWGVNGYPTSFIVDAHGVIQRKVIGEMDWDDVEMHTYIETLLSTDTTE